MSGASDQHSVIEPLSSKVGDTLIRGWQVGGEALALLIFGAFLVLVAFAALLNEYVIAAYLSLTTGFLIIAVITYLLIIKTILPLRKATRQIRDNAELLDSVQQSTLSLTHFINQISDYILLNTSEIVTAIKLSKSYLRDIPTAERIFSIPAFQRTEDLGYRVHEIAEKANTTVSEVGDSIARSDASKIKYHLSELKKLQKDFEEQWLKPKGPDVETLEIDPDKGSVEVMVDQKRLIIFETLAVRLIELFSDIAAKVDLQTLEGIEKLDELRRRYPMFKAGMDLLSISSTQELAKNLQSVLANTGQQLRAVGDLIKSNKADDLTNVIPTVDAIVKAVEGLRHKQTSDSTSAIGMERPPG